MAKVLIPPPLRQFTGRQDAVTLAGATVGEVLNALITHYQAEQLKAGGNNAN